MTELGHLLTADRVFAGLGWAQELRGGFYLGAISPDAHRATIGVDYRDLHFRSGRVVGRRLVDFLRHYLRPALRGREPEGQAFFAGWLSHVCADHIWRQHLRVELSGVWYRIVDGSPLESASLRQEFYEDCDCLDQILALDYAQTMEDIRWLLQHSRADYAIPPLRHGDINRWRQHVLMELLPPVAPELEVPQLLPAGFFERCRDEAVQETLSILDWEIKRLRGEA